MRRRIVKGLIIAIAVFSLVSNSLLALAVVTDYHHVGSLMHVLLLVKGRSLDPAPFGTILDGATSGVVTALNDPYSTYLSPVKLTQFREQMDGTFGGVGLILDTSNEAQLKVIRVLPGSPAERAGLKKGDIITAVNGQSVSSIKANPAAELMKGKIGTIIKLKVNSGKGNEKEYSLKRETLTLKSVEGKLVKLPEAVAYIKINSFNQNTNPQLEDFLKNAPSFEGVILDLRDNTGGTLEAAIEVANYFVPKGPVVHLVDRSGKRETYEVGGARLKVPVMVLVNGETASASEILAGAIQDTASGVLVGSKTYGKGVVQTIYELGDNSALKITTAKYLTSLGRDINKQGIIPDVVVEDKVTDQADPVYNKAVQLLKERM